MNYRDHIEACPTISHADERELGGVLAAGRTAQAALDVCDLTAVARRQAKRAVSDADLARHTLIKANLRLVIKVVGGYPNHQQNRDDLIGAGNIGLIKAVDKWDGAQTVVFSTFAYPRIQNEIQDCIRAMRPMYVSRHVDDQFRKVMGVQADAADRGQTMSVDELADECRLDRGFVADMLTVGDTPRSLDEPLSWSSGDEGAMELVDPAADVADQVTADMLPEVVFNALAGLPWREAQVLRLRFGLETGEPMSLQQVADRCGLSRQGVAQIEKRAIGRLREAGVSA